MRTTNLARSYQADVHQQMKFLEKNFTVSHRVNNEDGTSGYVARWINADAEQQYIELEKRFKKLKEEEERGLNDRNPNE